MEGEGRRQEGGRKAGGGGKGGGRGEEGGRKAGGGGEEGGRDGGAFTSVCPLLKKTPTFLPPLYMPASHSWPLHPPPPQLVRQLLIVAFMTSTMFANYPKNSAANANTYMSVIFFSLMFM